MTVTRFDWGAGPVGDAVRASCQGRLLTFVKDEESEPIALFTPAHRQRSDAGDWYGEHAGKWLCAAVRASVRTDDADLRARIDRVADFLAAQQEPGGYLGTYRPGAACRFNSPEAAGVRTWDLWTHAWTILGLLAAGRTEAAHRAGELILRTFPSLHRSVLDLGNHSGLSSMVVLQPLAELAAATGDGRYLRLALDTLEQAQARGLAFLSADKDVAEIGTGKAYQILWVLVGMLRLHRVAGEASLLPAVEALWENVAEHHLTPLGGPWGGIAAHKEVFNPKGFFSPSGMVETCSAATWLILSRELFHATANPRYADAVERTLLNTILGAMNPNGRDWRYFTFPNGRCHDTYHWACCKSSGALALEEAAPIVVAPCRDGVAINLYEPFQAHLSIDGASVRLALEAGTLHVEADRPIDVPIYLRQPGWGTVAVDCGPHVRQSTENGFLKLEAGWHHDRLALDIRSEVRVHPAVHSVDHHGQEIVRDEFVCVSKGPTVYAADLFDGYRRTETLRWPRLNPESVLRDEDGRIDLCLPAREPIPLVPYRSLQGWRSTWLQVAWQ